jgi:preprotein translocase subunit SecY
MLEKLANIFRVPDLRKRVLFTLGLLAVYRIGGHIPTPGINGDRLAQFFEQNRGSVLGFVDLFSGGNLRRLTIFALGIMPYITASIILQLLTVVYGRAISPSCSAPCNLSASPSVSKKPETSSTIQASVSL